MKKTRRILSLITALLLACVITVATVLSGCAKQKKYATITFSSTQLTNKVTVLVDEIAITSGSLVEYGKTLTISYETVADYDAELTINDSKVTPQNTGTYTYIVNEKNIKIVAAYTYNVPAYHTVTFFNNMGIIIDSKTVAHGETVAKPQDGTVDKAVFVGWYHRKETPNIISAVPCYSYYDFSQPVTQDIRLYEALVYEEEWNGNDGIAGDGIIYNGLVFTPINNNTEYSVRWFDNDDETINIPNMFNGKYVTEIEENGFKDCPAETLIFNGLLKSVGDNAFGSAVVDLSLNYNFFASFDLSGLTSLESLALCANNKLTQVNLNLPNLKELHLYSNMLTDIDLSGLISLEKLFLNNNKLTSITGLEKLTNLIWLSVNDNLLSNVSGLNELTNLELLDLGNNKFTQINLNNFADLKYLYLHNNQFTKIILNESSDLSFLNLSGNRLTNNILAEININRFTNLYSLNLSDNQLTKIDLTGLVNLNTLYLLNNQIKEIIFIGTSTLRILDLSNNKLDDSIFLQLNLSRFNDLMSLTLSYNQLVNISISNFAILNFINLTDNLLETITLEGLTNLAFLHLQNNNLSAEEISKITDAFPGIICILAGNPGYSD